MKKFGEKINKVRAEESKELSRAGKGEVLKHSRGPRNPGHLNPQV